MITNGPSPELMDTVKNLYDRRGGAYGRKESSFQS